MNLFRIYTFILLLFIINEVCNADIAPNPITANGVYTVDSCNIQLVSELVSVDMFNDSSKVECTFVLKNFSDSITIEVGFPEMIFEYHGYSEYNENDKNKFQIQVDDKILTEEQIKVPAALDNLYKKYMFVYHIEREYCRKSDSIDKEFGGYTKVEGGYTMYPTDTLHKQAEAAHHSLFKWRRTQPYFGSELSRPLNELKEKGNYPWYVWQVFFGKEEKKIIKVKYDLPSGIGYNGGHNRYFKYLLSTGAGWKGVIENAKIIVRFRNININYIEQVVPNNYLIDSNNLTINWNFTNLEPTKENDVYIRYYNPDEREALEDYQYEMGWYFKWGSWRFLSPVYWLGKIF